MYPTAEAKSTRFASRLTVPVAVRAAFWLLTLSMLAPAVPAFGQTTAHSAAEGEIQVLAVDELDEATGQWRSGLEYFLQTGKHRLLLGPGQTLASVAVPQINALTGAQSTLVALLNFTDLTVQPFTAREIEKRLVSNTDSTDQFLRENSYGKLWLEADVLDWKTMGISFTEIGEDGSLDSTRLLDEALKVLDPLVNLHDYARLILIFPHLPLGGLSGMGTVGNWTINTPGEGQWTGSVAWIDGAWAVSPVFAHQLGHNLGFRHASSVAGLGENVLDPSYPLGVWAGAGDPGDVMGAYSCFQHFSSIWKSQALWLPESSIQNVTSSGQYLVEQLEQASSGVKALKIPLGTNGSGKPVEYWIEYRKSIGTFGTSDAVQVRLLSNTIFDGSSASQDSIRFEGIEQPGGIEGTVAGDPGDGIPGVWVEAYDSSGHYLGSAETDSAGHYALNGIAAGSVLLKTYNTMGYVDEYYDGVFASSSAKLVTVSPGAVTSGINFHLMAGGFISGKVMRDSDGEAIPGVVVDASFPDAEFQKSATTDALGQYSLSGLRPGSYRLRTYQSGEYVNEYYKDARFKDAATLVSVAAGEHKANIDISLALGGTISGRVTSDADKQGIEGAWIDAYDLQGKYLDIYVRTDSTGYYSLSGVPGGSCVLYAYKTGYRGEYYDNVTVRSQAKPVAVTPGAQTTGIDFGLARSSSASVRAPARTGIGGGEWQRGSTGTVLLANDGTAQADFLPGRSWDISAGQAFVDPYRGVKIELIEKTGSGAGAAALLRIGLSGLQTNYGAVRSFGQVRVGSHSYRTVTVTNKSSTSTTLGQANLAGRNASSFAITQDGCSGKTLAASKTCNIGLAFAPTALSSTSFAGDFAVLRIASNDVLRPTGAVSLYGIAQGVDLAITNSLLADFEKRQRATYRLQVQNQGTVSTSAPVTVSDELPPGLSFVSASSDSFTCTSQGQTVACTSTNLSLCASYCAAVIDLNIEIDRGVRGVIVNRASVTSSEDLNAANNMAEDRSDLRRISQRPAFGR